MTFFISSSARVVKPESTMTAPSPPEKTRTLFIMPQGNAMRWIAGVMVVTSKRIGVKRPPFDSSSRTISGRPTSKAVSIGVPEWRVSAFRSAPFERRYSTAARWPPAAAMCSGVPPPGSLALAWPASASINARNLARFPVDAAWKMVWRLTGGGPGGAVGVIARLAYAPPEPLPAHRAMPPLLASPRSSTTRLGAFAPFTKTSTFPLARTMRAWNQALGSGGGSSAFSNWPGRSARSFCQVLAGCAMYCTAWERCSSVAARKLNGRK